LAALLLIGAFCFPAIISEARSPENTETTAQAAQDFLLVNKTGVEIYALYVTPHEADDWGDDILGVDTLAPNESIEIKFSRKEKAKFWDLRVEDEEGEYIEWEKLNLLKISSVTLYFKNGKATAIVQ
jgi:hypothetical protein